MSWKFGDRGACGPGKGWVTPLHIFLCSEAVMTLLEKPLGDQIFLLLLNLDQKTATSLERAQL